MVSRATLAECVLAIHLAIIAFNVFGLIVIPLGALRRWRFVGGPWRWAHLASLGVVAVQAVAGRACFLTLWQSALAGTGERQPLVMRWINAVIFWPLPEWVFAALYLAAFALTLLFLWLAPPRPLGRP